MCTYYVRVGLDVIGGKKAMRRIAEEVLSKTERGEMSWKNEDGAFVAEYGVTANKITIKEKGNVYWLEVCTHDLPYACAHYGEESLFGLFRGPVEKLWRLLNS